MIDFSSEIKILFMQKPAVLEDQRHQASDLINGAFPAAVILFASRPEDINEGTEVDIVITPTLEWLPCALARLKAYKWIHFLSAGVEKIWCMDFAKDDILLTKSSGVNSIPMSEYALGAMLYFAKQFGRFKAQSQQRIWERVWLEELTGKTLVILGLGHVGQAVAAKAKAFGMRVTGMQRRPRPHKDVEHVVPPGGIMELLPDADYIVVCLPLTQDTRGFVDNGFLNRTKPGCILIDMSRGGVVDEEAVLHALESNQLRGVALDVFESQPLDPASRLWARSDILLTPHVSGTTPYYLQRALGIFIENAGSLMNTGKLLTSVNVTDGY